MSNTTTGDEWRQYIGPGGEAVTIIMIFIPIIFVVVVTLIPKPLPTTISLHLAAIFLLLIRLAYLSSDIINTFAGYISGVFEVLTPLTIVCGAIYLFNTMEGTGCMPWIMRELKLLSGGHPIAEFMLIAWAFAYLVEGASGFGTPAALAAPMLAQLGHPKFKAVVAVLLTNTVATVFGAVGTPIWFGFGSVTEKYYGENDQIALREIGLQAAIGLLMVSLITPLLACLYLIPRKVIFQNLIFFYLSIFSVMGPVVVISLFSYEFPTILGGLFGLGITALLVKFKIGLKALNPDDMGEEWQILNKRDKLYLKSSKESVSINNRESNINSPNSMHTSSSHSNNTINSTEEIHDNDNVSNIIVKDDHDYDQEEFKNEYGMQLEEAITIEMPAAINE
eukprot:Pgem_evm1s9636